MEIDKLVHIVNNPKTSHCKDVEIESLKDKFPYCQTFTLISLMKKHQQGAFGFEEELEGSAHKIIDRGVLHDYLHQELPIQEEVPESLTSNESETETKLTPELKEIHESNEIIEKLETETSQVNTESFTQLDFDIINSAIDSSIQQEVDEELEQIQDNNEEQEFNEEVPLQETLSVEVVKEQNTVEQKEADSSSKSFIGWLKNQEAEKTHENPSENQNTEVEIEKTHSEADAKSVDKHVRNEILEKFITEEPRISKPKKEFFSPTKKAKESLTENDDLITETLAKIYVLQKNYIKAIDAYEKLSLIYPEKKTFFANQIQRIKDKQNI